MQKNLSEKTTGVSVTTDPTRAAAATFTDTGGDARASAGTDGSRECGEGATAPVQHSPHDINSDAPKGTPPSNTVPLKYNPDTFKALRYGVDSLYVSYPGVLSDEWNKKLAGLKELAQDESESAQALAQVVIGEHIFEVRDKGRGRFAYVLTDNCYHLQASNKKSTSMPMAYVQISSEYLASVGIEQAEKSLRYIVDTLGVVNEPANISRVDLFVDFSAELRMDTFDPLCDWVTRTESIDLHYRHNQFSGWSFGMGGDIGARLYNKRLEVEKKSKKFYIFELWLAAGWDTSKQVWRMEFEAKREVLKQLGIRKLDNLLQLQTALWVYLTEDWLRLSIPSLTDINPSRWPAHPLWTQITDVFNKQSDQPKLRRFTPARLPEDERLFIHGLGGLTSFMATRGIEDMAEGIGEYFHQAKIYHLSRTGTDGIEKYVGRKVKAKNRRYNTAVNHRMAAQEPETDNAYQRAKDGDDGDA